MMVVVLIMQKHLNTILSDWKNQLTELCNGDYIFQIDADEYPHDSLISQLPIILEANPKKMMFI